MIYVVMCIENDYYGRETPVFANQDRKVVQEYLDLLQSRSKEPIYVWLENSKWNTEATPKPLGKYYYQIDVLPSEIDEA